MQGNIRLFPENPGIVAGANVNEVAGRHFEQASIIHRYGGPS
jgi:hypothetical protein